MFWNLLITTPVSVLVGFNCLIFLFIMDHIALLWFIPNNYWLDAKHCDFYHVRSCMFLFSSVQLSRSVMFNSLRPHGMQHARLPCLSPTPRAYSNSCPSSQWCHLTISSSGVPFSSCLQSFPASVQFSSVQLLSHVRLFATLWMAACQASLSVTNSRSWLRLTSIESVMPSSHLILCRPLLLLPTIPPSISLFQ